MTKYTHAVRNIATLGAGFLVAAAAAYDDHVLEPRAEHSLTKAEALAAFAKNKKMAQRRVWRMNAIVAAALGVVFLCRLILLLDDWIWSRALKRNGGHVEPAYDLQYQNSPSYKGQVSSFDQAEQPHHFVGAGPMRKIIPVWQRLPRASAAFVRKYFSEVRVPIVHLSLGEAAVVLAYIGMLIGLLVTDAPNIPPNPVVAFRVIGIANRAGLMCFGSLPFQILLSCRISVVGFLLGIPYDRVQYLHRWVGRSTLALAITHATCKLIQMHTFQDHTFRRFGLGAFVIACFMLVISHRFTLRSAYEVFAYLHIASIVSFVTLAWLHQPGHKYYLITSIGIWALDRTLRWIRLVLYNGLWRMRGTKRTEAVLRLLSHDTTRLELFKPDFPHWKPGAFAFISTPGLTFFPQSHPFTIASRPLSYAASTMNNARSRFGSDSEHGLSMAAHRQKTELLGTQPNLIFLIRARSGWTRTLHTLAQSRAFPSIPVLVDGPYDSSPVLHKTFDTVLLFAGGAGISWTLPMLTDLIEQRRKRNSVVRKVIWVCVLRHYVNYDWFYSELETMVSTGGQGWVDVRIHYTTSAEDIASVPTFFRPGRPNLEAIIENSVQEAQGRIFVGVSGPQGPSDEARRCVRQLTSPSAILRGDARGDIYFHNELFGW